MFYESIKLQEKRTSKNSEQVITCIKVGQNKDIIRTKPDYTKTGREKDQVKGPSENIQAFTKKRQGEKENRQAEFIQATIKQYKCTPSGQ